MINEQTSTALTTTYTLSSNDRQLIDTWLYGRSDDSTRLYERTIMGLLAFLQKGVTSIDVPDLQTWVSNLHGSENTRATAVKIVKSLFSFAMKLGYITVNPAILVKIPEIKNTLVEKIMDETDVIRMIALETDVRNHALLRLMYQTGVRVSEAARLTWRDVTSRKEGAQITVYGKGGKTRFLLISTSMLNELRALGEQQGPLFKSRKGNEALTERAITRIVKEAAIRAGLSPDVSAHWLRHANASHSLDNGASIAVVQASLGHKDLATTSRYTHARPNDTTAKYIKI